MAIAGTTTIKEEAMIAVFSVVRASISKGTVRRAIKRSALIIIIITTTTRQTMSMIMMKTLAANRKKNRKKIPINTRTAAPSTNRYLLRIPNLLSKFLHLRKRVGLFF